MEMKKIVVRKQINNIGTKIKSVMGNLKQSPTQRNINPHKEAKIAMWVWGKRYSEFDGGSMDFWDSLPNYEKLLCKQAIDDIKECKKRAILK